MVRILTLAPTTGEVHFTAHAGTGTRRQDFFSAIAYALYTPRKFSWHRTQLASRVILCCDKLSRRRHCSSSKWEQTPTPAASTDPRPSWTPPATITTCSSSPRCPSHHSCAARWVHCRACELTRRPAEDLSFHPFSPIYSLDR